MTVRIPATGIRLRVRRADGIPSPYMYLNHRVISAMKNLIAINGEPPTRILVSDDQDSVWNQLLEHPTEGPIIKKWLGPEGHTLLDLAVVRIPAPLGYFAILGANSTTITIKDFYRGHYAEEPINEGGPPGPRQGLASVMEAAHSVHPLEDPPTLLVYREVPEGSHGLITGLHFGYTDTCSSGFGDLLYFDRQNDQDSGVYAYAYEGEWPRFTHSKCHSSDPEEARVAMTRDIILKVDALLHAYKKRYGSRPACVVIGKQDHGAKPTSFQLWGGTHYNHGIPGRGVQQITGCRSTFWYCSVSITATSDIPDWVTKENLLDDNKMSRLVGVEPKEELMVDDTEAIQVLNIRKAP